MCISSSCSSCQAAVAQTHCKARVCKLLTDKHHHGRHNALWSRAWSNVAKTNCRQKGGDVVERSDVLCRTRRAGQVVVHSTYRRLTIEPHAVRYVV